MLTKVTYLFPWEWEVVNRRTPVGTVQVTPEQNVVCRDSTPSGFYGYELSGLYRDQNGEMWFIQWNPTLPRPEVPHHRTYRCWRYLDIYAPPTNRHLMGRQFDPSMFM